MNLFYRILVVLLLEVTLGLGYAFADCTRDRNGVVFARSIPVAAQSGTTPVKWCAGTAKSISCPS